jgi:hypothetical protein
MSCVRMERKSLKVLICISCQVPGSHTIILYAKGFYVQNGGNNTVESFLRAGFRQDNVSVDCAMTFWTRYGNNPPTRKFIYDWYTCGKSWIIDLTSATSHMGLTPSACKV